MMLGLALNINKDKVFRFEQLEDIFSPVTIDLRSLPQNLELDVGMWTKIRALLF